MTSQLILDPRQRVLAGVAGILLLWHTAGAAETPSYGPELQGYPYPFPVQQFDFASQRQTLHMVYTDVKPKNPAANPVGNNLLGRTAVLLHGKNFCAATWRGTGIDNATLIAHSTGGMIAMGLEDWKAIGVPAISVDDWYARELKTNADSIRRYEQGTYYAGPLERDFSSRGCRCSRV